MRVGAAANQATSIAAVLVGNGQLTGDPEVVATYVDELARKLLNTMENIQGGLSSYAQPAQAQAYVAPAPVQQQQAVANVQAAFAGTTTVAPTAPSGSAGYNTTFSGASKPLKLAEHPELDGWLHAQAAAVGVDQVWDNRGKPGYVAAINSGAAKTPPPFRSATDGIDKSFWPPSAR